jgi:hypothetical protein
VHGGKLVFREVRRYNLDEHLQGVAVGAQHFYAIGELTVSKYDKTKGKLIKRWHPSAETPIVHLNSGIVLDGKLYCAHSNYPATPPANSVEIWDANSLQHIGKLRVSLAGGHLAWVDLYEDAWWGVLANYTKKVGLPGYTKGTEATTLVKFDRDWNHLQSWKFAQQAISRFEPSSNSGGAWGPDGRLYCTSSKKPELLCLTVPADGSVLRLVEVVPVSLRGQGFAWDREQRGVIYGINRRPDQVVVSRLVDR